MKPDKQKQQIIVVAALFVAVIAIGAFQMTSGSPEPVVASGKKAEKEAQKGEDENKPTIKNPTVAMPLKVRDPFQPAPFSLIAKKEPNEELEAAPRVSRPDRIPRFNPLPGTTSSGPSTEIKPLLPEPPKFGYLLTGVIVGDTPAAVFIDQSGNQRLVTEGGALDGDSRVIKIQSGSVRVKFHEQTIDIPIGATPND